MPAQSQQQQKLFGLALSVKRGETPRTDASKDVLNIVDTMSEKEIEDFAGTAHKGLPKKVEETIREMVRTNLSESIPKMYKTFLAVQKKVKELESSQKDLLEKWKSEKDDKKKAKLFDKLKQGTKVLKATRKNLSDIEEKFVNNMSYDTSYSESMNEDENPCWKGYEMVGMKMKNGKEVPNCVPKNESLNEGMVEIEVDLYANMRSRTPSKTVPMKISDTASISKILNHTTFKSYKEKYMYVEFNLGNTFIGSASKDNNWKFMKGRGFSDAKFKESVNEGRVEKEVLQKISKFETLLGYITNDDQYKPLVSKVKKEIDKLKKQIKKNESVTESASRTAMEIGGLTGMNKDFIQKFVDTNELDIEKVFKFVKKGKLKDRMNFVSAVAGKPNNPLQKKMIKMFK